MDIGEITIAQANQIAAMLSREPGDAPPSPHIGKICLIRAYASGVHCGTLVAQHGRQVELANARRLWRWRAKTGISLSEVATVGIVQSGSRVCAVVEAMTILDALEIIPMTVTAASSVRDTPVYEP